MRSHLRLQPLSAALLALCAAPLLLECASPGPPRPPSLKLPRPVRDLTAARVGDVVELRFTVPQETTDNAALRPATVPGQLCRAVEAGPCVPLPGLTPGGDFVTRDPAGAANVVTLRDVLDTPLRSGAAKLLTYRVEFFSASVRTPQQPGQRSAGPSRPAYAVAGQAPPPVEGLRLDGSRAGILLHWKAAPSSPAEEVLLRREQVGASVAGATPPQPTESGSSKDKGGSPWLQANSVTGVTLDDSVEPGETYTYVAQRRRSVQLAGHALEMRSELSPPVVLQLSDSFALPAPAGLTAAGFGAPAHYAVDLVWEPVNDPRLFGYRVTRTEVDRATQPLGAPKILNGDTPVVQPAFHDAEPNAALRYRYEVIAVDARGNRSPAATVLVDPLSDTPTP